MKRRNLLYALPMVAILLVACSDSETDTSNETEKTEVGKQEESTTTTEKNEVGKATEESATTTEKNEVGKATEDTETTETEKAEVGKTVVDDPTKEGELIFDEFSLEVKYPKGEYSLDYETQFSGEEAELEDERKKTKIVGEEALNNLKPLLEKFKMDENTSDEAVKEELFSIIKIDDDYTSIELDVTFKNNKEKSYVFNK